MTQCARTHTHTLSVHTQKRKKKNNLSNGKAPHQTSQSKAAPSQYFCLNHIVRTIAIYIQGQRITALFCICGQPHSIRSPLFSSCGQPHSIISLFSICGQPRSIISLFSICGQPRSIYYLRTTACRDKQKADHSSETNARSL